MTRSLYAYRDGKVVEIARDYDYSEASPYVHDDTMAKPLKHPVSGKMFDSKSKYMEETRRLGLQVVGNDLLSKRPHRKREKITDAMIMDRIERAEAIYSDPTKFRARQNENLERLERASKLLNERR